MMSDTQKYGVNLAEQGFRVFPMHGVKSGSCTCGNPKCDSPGKHPRIKDWPVKASSDPAVVAKMFQHYQTTNYGIATGNGLLVIDVDGPEGEASLQELERTHSALPPTRESITGRGRHLLFHTPANALIKNKVSLGPKLDVRAERGCIVAPGSIHVSGKRYEWKDESIFVADAPEWLVQFLVNSKPEAPANTGIDGVIREGERNSTITRIVCDAFRHSRSADDVLKLALSVNTQQCVPPLSDSEVCGIVERIAESNDMAYAEEDTPVPLRWYKVDATEVLSNMHMDRLTDVQFGWRFRLMSYAWLNGGRLPKDIDELARMARATSKAKFMKEWREPLFDFMEVTECSETYLVNSRLVKEHTESTETWRKRKAAGRASAAAKSKGKDSKGAAA